LVLLTVLRLLLILDEVFYGDLIVLVWFCALVVAVWPVCSSVRQYVRQ